MPRSSSGASIPVIGRFSLSGGLPDQADKPETVRGLALLFRVNGQQWRTAMVNIPVFLDSTPQAFYERILVSKPVPDTGKADPQKMAAFLDRHPETVAAMKIVKQSPPTAGFADSTFYGLNAFYFANSAGVTVPVRWSVVPLDSVVPQGGAGAAPPASPGKDHLFNDLIRTVAQRPLNWRLMLTIGEPGDPTNDATKPWPQSRRSINAGTITITAVQTEEAGNARDINFDPLVLPDGITASDDPLPAARSAVYARSFTRRAEEPKSPSEVDVRRAPVMTDETAKVSTACAAVRPPVPDSALADGADGYCATFRRRDHGRFAGLLPAAAGDPPAVRGVDPGLRRGAPGESAHPQAAAVSGDHERCRTSHRVVVGISALCPATDPAVGRMGHAVGR